jgi:hypothetical protein
VCLLLPSSRQPLMFHSPFLRLNKSSFDENIKPREKPSRKTLTHTKVIIELIPCEVSNVGKMKNKSSFDVLKAKNCAQFHAQKRNTNYARICCSQLPCDNDIIILTVMATKH